MQDSNLRGARAPTTVFETDALPGSANPPLSCVAPRGVEPRPPDLHPGALPVELKSLARQRARAWSDARESNAVCPHPK